MNGQQQIAARVLGSLETLNRELATLQVDAGADEFTKRPRRRRSSAPMSPNSEVLAPPAPLLHEHNCGDHAGAGDSARESRLELLVERLLFRMLCGGNIHDDIGEDDGNGDKGCGSAGDGNGDSSATVRQNVHADGFADEICSELVSVLGFDRVRDVFGAVAVAFDKKRQAALQLTTEGSSLQHSSTPSMRATAAAVEGKGGMQASDGSLHRDSSTAAGRAKRRTSIRGSNVRAGNSKQIVDVARGGIVDDNGYGHSEERGDESRHEDGNGDIDGNGSGDADTANDDIRDGDEDSDEDEWLDDFDLGFDTMQVTARELDALRTMHVAEAEAQINAEANTEAMTSASSGEEYGSLHDSDCSIAVKTLAVGKDTAVSMDSGVGVPLGADRVLAAFTETQKLDSLTQRAATAADMASEGPEKKVGAEAAKEAGTEDEFQNQACDPCEQHSTESKQTAPEMTSDAGVSTAEEHARAASFRDAYITEFEEFSLRVVHSRGRTGFFRADDEFEYAQGATIAGRYHVQRILGKAAFSIAYQCVDLAVSHDGRAGASITPSANSSTAMSTTTTGNQVCVKIIKNDKRFFDQALDEIRLLRLLQTRAQQCGTSLEREHILTLLDCFYHQEQLCIVTELLLDNLYVFGRYCRMCGDPEYFTLSRMASIAHQLMRALQFVHGAGIIHADIKPENIVFRSYTSCVVTLIDFGTSAFIADPSESYAQSRDYRAPEVVLGLTYSQKIDVWSVGAVLAEIYTGRVLFKSRSAAALLARMQGVVNEALPPSMLRYGQGRNSHDLVTRAGVVFERRPDMASSYALLRPKRTSLHRRLKLPSRHPLVDFLRQCLRLDPLQRWSAEQLLQHPWLRDI